MATRRRRIVVGLLVVLALLLGYAIFRLVAGPDIAPEVPTAQVELGTVSTEVTATGTLTPLAQQNLGFRLAGQLAEVNVKVGDRVTPGQVLARLDPAGFETALQQAQADLAEATASLDSTVNGNAAEAARHALSTAQASLAAAERQAAAVNAADTTAIRNAERQLSHDRSVLDDAEDELREDRKDCDRDDESPACDQVPTDEDAVNSAEGQVIASEAALASARAQERTDRASNEVSIASAKATVVANQDEVTSQTVNRTHTIEMQEAAVARAEAGVDSAQRDLDATTLLAPAGGTIASLTGTVGEPVAAFTAATTLAPGTLAPQPATADASTSGGAAAGTFAVLSNIDAFQVVAPFAEADAAQLAPGQRVTISYDAVEDVTSPGTVLSVAPVATTIQNVINYYVTISVDETDPSLRAGLTANAAVVVGETTDVLTVPNTVVQRRGLDSFVTVLEPDGTQREVEIETGAVGDQVTEVSGLEEGQRVVIPQVTPSPGGLGGPG